MAQSIEVPRRIRLTRDRVPRAAVALADEIGIDALSMRKLGEELGVVPITLYKHVADKEELLDGMIVVGEIDPSISEPTGRARSGSGSSRRGDRSSVTPWAPGVIESRTNPSPVMLAHIDWTIGMFLRTTTILVL